MLVKKNPARDQFDCEDITNVTGERPGQRTKILKTFELREKEIAFYLRIRI